MQNEYFLKRNNVTNLGCGIFLNDLYGNQNSALLTLVKKWTEYEKIKIQSLKILFFLE